MAREIVLSSYLSLDGVMEEPAWTMAYWADDIAEFKQAELFASDTLMLGRVTYQGFAEAWPQQQDEAGFADRMNSMPKQVVSSTLTNPTWQNSTIIPGTDLVAAVQALKETAGTDILIYGSGMLAEALREHDLIDRYQLLVHPLVLGKGKRLFEGTAPTNLQLVSSTTYSTGVVRLTYRLARDEKESAQ